MKSKVIMCLMAVFTMLGMSSCGYERVDAGCEVCLHCLKALSNYIQG